MALIENTQLFHCAVPDLRHHLIVRERKISREKALESLESLP